jgi:MFS family permease
MNVRLAGYVATLNSVGAGLGQFTAVFLLTRFAVSRLVGFGIAVSALSDVGCIFVHGAELLAVLRLLSGFGHGFILVAVTNWLARLKRADRGFGAFMLLQVVFISPMIMAVPYVQSLIGPSAPYVLLLVLAAISAAFTPLLNLNGGDVPVKRAAPAALLEPRALPWKVIVYWFLAGAAPTLFAIAVMGPWIYLQLFGMSLGHQEALLSQVLAAVTLAGIPASLFLMWLGNRIGRVIPTLVSLLGIIASIMMFLFGPPSIAGFALGTTVFTVAWCFITPYLQAIQSDLDRSGRLAAASSLPVTIGSALGPAIFAFMLGNGGYRAAFFVSIAFFAASLVAALIPAFAADRLTGTASLVRPHGAV